MNMDTLVFDIETSNFFTDPGVGWNNFDALKISAVGVYSYDQDTYLCFEEHEMDKLGDLFRNAKTIVGFSINRYDVPVLNAYFQRLGSGVPNLFLMERLDLLDEIERVAGHRISLERLAQANLGTGKTGHGTHAAELYRAGKMEELKAYCLKDVELTKKLFDLYRDRKYFFLPVRDSEEFTKLEFFAPHAAEQAPAAQSSLSI
jgi:DEAD/DEAH box helicase domain-containing protein